MKLKLIASVLVLMVALTGVLGATAAYFSDTEQSTTTVAAGTLDLVIGNNGVTIPAEIKNMAPGQTREVIVIKLKNIGTIDGIINFKGMNFTDNENGLVGATEIAYDNTDAGELSQRLTYTVKFYKSMAQSLTEDDIDYSSMTSQDIVNIATYTWDDLMNGQLIHPAMPTLKAGHYCYAVIEVVWTPSELDNYAQSDSTIMNGIFELTQKTA